MSGAHLALWRLWCSGLVQNGVACATSLGLCTNQVTGAQGPQENCDSYGFINSSPVFTPMDPSGSLTSVHALSMPEDKAFMHTVPYVSTVGTLMYLAIAMHPDIAFAMGVFCCFMAHPGPEHWKAVKHLFHYLHGTIDYCLMYTPDASTPKLFYMYSNADHSGNCNNRHFTSAYVVKIGLGAVLCMLHLQPIVVLSTTEAKFIAAASAGQEVVWMHQLLGELGFSIAGPVTVFLRPLSPCDLVCAESQMVSHTTPFCPSPLHHKHHSANWAPVICCSNHIGHCVVQPFHLPCSVVSTSLRSVFHMLVASMVLFPLFKWVAI
jgi:hypothetical protein